MFIVSCFIILLNLLLMFFHNVFVEVIAFIVEVVVFFVVAVAVYVLFRLGHMYSTQCINCFSFFLADCPTELRPTLNLCGLQRLLRNCHAGFPRVQWVRLNKKSPPCFAHDIVALDTGVAPRRLHKTSCAFVSRHLTQVQMVMFCFSKFLSPHVCHG